MNNIEESTYIYVLGQFDDNDELMFSESFKIGKSDDLKQRFQAYKNNPMCINPKYIRVIEKYKKHHVPDKPLLSFLDEFYEPLIVRKSKLRELCSFKGQEALDLFDDLIKRMPGIIKYYIDPQEIQELFERKSIIKNVINNLVNDVISENLDIVSDNYYSGDMCDKKIEDIKTIIARSMIHLNKLYKDNNNKKYKTTPKQFKLYMNNIRKLIDFLNEEEISYFMKLNTEICKEKVDTFLNKIKNVNNIYIHAIISKLIIYYDIVCEKNIQKCKNIFRSYNRNCNSIIQKWIKYALEESYEVTPIDDLMDNMKAWCDDEGYNFYKIQKQEVKESLIKEQTALSCDLYGPLQFGKKLSDGSPNGTWRHPKFNFKSIED
jgi:hypothetical protein